MFSKLISVIIPVHNGGKWIKKLVSDLLLQDYQNIEVILIENDSSDNSAKICQELSISSPKIHSHQCLDKGTSLARKKGVEQASGTYIIFADQDDYYLNKHSISAMVNSIQEDRADICQFSYFKEYFGIIKRKANSPVNQIIGADYFRRKQLKTVLGAHDNSFNTPVWNKIYKTEVLKDAVTHITKPLYYAEDELLNLWAFTSPECQSISVRNEAYYVWRANIGFSSSGNSGDALLKDYEIVKPEIIRAIMMYDDNPQETLWDIHGESLYSMKAIVKEQIKQKLSNSLIIHNIDEYGNMNFIKEAKYYFNNYQPESRIWDDLHFLASDYDADSYFDYCYQELAKKNKIDSLKSVAKKLLRNN